MGASIEIVRHACKCIIHVVQAQSRQWIELPTSTLTSQHQHVHLSNLDHLSPFEEGATQDRQPPFFLFRFSPFPLFPFSFFFSNLIFSSSTPSTSFLHVLYRTQSVLILHIYPKTISFHASFDSYALLPERVKARKKSGARSAFPFKKLSFNPYIIHIFNKETSSYRAGDKPCLIPLLFILFNLNFHKFVRIFRGFPRFFFFFLFFCGVRGMHCFLFSAIIS